MSELNQWLGKSVKKYDEISAVLVRRMAATLGVQSPQKDEPLPPLWHWMFFQPEVLANEIGADGHPALGGFMPPANGRNRMWAGGSFEFNKPLIIGQTAVCVSTILDIQEKQGNTGSLIFVTVGHEYFQEDELLFSEKQNIVYREPSAPKLESEGPTQIAQWNNALKTDATLLFRYSALTFNGHRIHYDYPYVTGTEGYANLVVHGPLMATWSLMGFTQAHPDKQLKRFEYRGVRPTLVPDTIYAQGCVLNEGQADLWISNPKGVIQKAKVEFI